MTKIFCEDYKTTCIALFKNEYGTHIPFINLIFKKNIQHSLLSFCLIWVFRLEIYIQIYVLFVPREEII